MWYIWQTTCRSMVSWTRFDSSCVVRLWIPWWLATIEIVPPHVRGVKDGMLIRYSITRPLPDQLYCGLVSETNGRYTLSRHASIECKCLGIFNVSHENCRFILTYWGRDKMADISYTTFSNGFSCMKMCIFRLRFHWNFFPGVQLTIFHHWFK